MPTPPVALLIIWLVLCLVVCVLSVNEDIMVDLVTPWVREVRERRRRDAQERKWTERMNRLMTPHVNCRCVFPDPGPPPGEVVDAFLRSLGPGAGGPPGERGQGREP